MNLVNVTTVHRERKGQSLICPLSDDESTETLFQKVKTCDCDKIGKTEVSESGKEWSNVSVDNISMVIKTFNYKFVRFTCASSTDAK